MTLGVEELLLTAVRVQSLLLERRWCFCVLGGNAIQRQTRLLRGVGTALILFSLVLPQRAVCADLPTGKVVWWGRDVFPRGTYSEHTNGVIEIGNEVLSNVVAIAGGPMQGLALKSDSTVVSFGFGWNGWNEVPLGLSNVASIAIEGGFCWAIKHDGTVASWGGAYKDEKNIVAGLSNVTAIASAGSQGYLALKKDGTVSGFSLYDSVLPDGSAATPPVRAVRVHGQPLSNVVALASGDDPLVLKKDGTVLHLTYWKPGAARPEPVVTKAEPDGITIDMGGEYSKTPYDYTSAEPILVKGQALTNIIAIASGGLQALALRSDGTVVSWGTNYPGETAVPQGLKHVSEIAASEHLWLALKSDSTVVAGGGNYSGQTSVPVGLSNVVAIAAAGDLGFALTTGTIPASVFTYPHGRLEEMEREADLVFKGRVISTSAATNASFPYWGKPHATRFSLTSVLQGHLRAKDLVFWHNTGEPGPWSGGRPPSSHQFDPGNSYLVFAGSLGRSDNLYSVPPDATNRPNEFRQLCHDGVMRTLDARPFGARGVKDAHWAELGLLLQDTNTTNQLYAIDTLDRMSVAGRGDDKWRRSDDFKRKAVLSALLALITNKDEQVASRAISCFETESNALTRLGPFAAALVRVANESLYPSCRLAAISALSGTADEAVSHSLGQLLTNADENIRVGAVRLLPRFPAGFAEPALRERAGDESANVRSVVADVIGDGKYERLLPTLATLFADPVGRDRLIEPLTMEFLRAGQRWSNIGDVHTSAGFALVKFDPDQVADILKANLKDPGFHINFVSKLAEKDAEPWLPELGSILEERLKQVDEILKLAPNDPRRYTNPTGQRVLLGTYAKCWEDIRQYLLRLPPKKFSNGEMDRYMDLLEKTVQPVQGMSVHEAEHLYELYRTKGLAERAHEIRRKYDKTDGWWFDDFDRNHEAAVKQ